MFDFEWLAADLLFEHFARGAVPSIDTLYDDLRRFGPDEREQLEAVVADHGLRLLRERQPKRITIDIDTTVTPVFGHQEGALPPQLPPDSRARSGNGHRAWPAAAHGDTALGEADVEDVQVWLDRAATPLGAMESSPRASTLVGTVRRFLRP